MNDSVGRREMDMEMEIQWLVLFPGRTPVPPDVSLRGANFFRFFKL